MQILDAVVIACADHMTYHEQLAELLSALHSDRQVGQRSAMGTAGGHVSAEERQQQSPGNIPWQQWKACS